MIKEKTLSSGVAGNVLYTTFAANVAARGEQAAVITPRFRGASVTYERTSFLQLHEKARRYGRGLSALGLRAGDRVMMLVPPGVPFLALTLAVTAQGGVPVLLDPGMGIENLGKCLTESRPQGFIGSAKAHLLRLKFPRFFAGLTFAVQAGMLPFPALNLSFLETFAPEEPALSPAEKTDEQTGLIAYTSGATGTPKGVVFTRRMLSAQIALLREEFGLAAGGVDMPLLPAFALFGIALGLTVVPPPFDPARPLSLDPAQAAQIIRDLDVASSFGSPTLWAKIADHCLANGETLPSLRRVFIAGAGVSAETRHRVTAIVPNGEAFTPYGATEALPITLAPAQEIQRRQGATAKGGEIGTCIGVPARGVSARIIRITDGELEHMTDATPLPGQEIGEIIVRGDNVSRAYLFRDDATRNAKIADGENFWHRTGDAGYQDAEGTLYYCGRLMYRVETPEGCLYSEPVERIFAPHERMYRAALIRYCGGPALCVEPKPGGGPRNAAERRIFRRELREIGATTDYTRAIHRIFFHPSFPVDARHNAKIFRDKLGAWAESHGDAQEAGQ